MRVSTEKAAENRNALLQAASKLFRRHGIDNVGVAEIAREAGLTHGALYAHFHSKEEIAAEAFSYGFRCSMDNIKKWKNKTNPSFEDYSGALISNKMRDNLENGCPLTASASEIGRHGNAISANFLQAFNEMVAMIEKTLNHEIPAPERQQIAITTIAAQIGAITIARAIKKASTVQSDAVIKSVHNCLNILNSQ